MLDIIIIGAGPSGLACAIEAQKASLSYLVIEKGGITDAIRRFPTNLTFFSTPELLELGDIPFSTPNVRPNRIEVLNYYRRIVDYFHLDIALHSRVVGICCTGDGFDVTLADGQCRSSRHVIIATGYFDFTNRLGVEGEDLPHVRHFYDEPYACSGTDVVVVGGRNSAVEAALELYRHGARVTMVHRGPELGSIKYWILPDIENRIKQGSIQCKLSTVVQRIESGNVTLFDSMTQTTAVVAADFVLALIGYRPDEQLLRGAGVVLDDKTLIPDYDPRTFATNVDGLYIAGSVACGCETWNIFIENGRAHAKPIIDHIREKA